MKKKLTVAILYLAVILNSYAGEKTHKKEYSLDEKGYVGNVGLSLSSGAMYSIGGSLTTSHGYSFGNGLWMGGGLSLLWPFDEAPVVPVFAEAKYAFDLGKVNPFAACKIGVGIGGGEQPLGYVSPSFGVDYGRWSFFASYDAMDVVKFASFGFAWNFR